MQDKLPYGTNEFNPSFTFDSLVTGKHNQLVRNAAHSLATRTDLNYNPLFIFGSEGLGKTHILHAVGNELQKRFPETVVRYICATDFVKHYIEAIQNDCVREFTNGFRNLDVLLLDNIQQIKSGSLIQFEMLNVFNKITDFGKRVVVASETEPTKLTHIAYTFRARFQHGLMAEIGLPDADTRMVLLRRKLEEKKITLPEDLITLIAEKCIGSVGQLEGALVTLHVHYTEQNGVFTIDDANRILNLYESDVEYEDNMSRDCGEG